MFSTLGACPNVFNSISAFARIGIEESPTQHGLPALLFHGPLLHRRAPESPAAIRSPTTPSPWECWAHPRIRPPSRPSITGSARLPVLPRPQHLQSPVPASS